MSRYFAILYYISNYLKIDGALLQIMRTMQKHCFFSDFSDICNDMCCKIT